MTEELGKRRCTFHLPHAICEEIKRRARSEGKTKSQIVQEAVMSPAMVEHDTNMKNDRQKQTKELITALEKECEELKEEIRGLSLGTKK